MDGLLDSWVDVWMQRGIDRHTDNLFTWLKVISYLFVINMYFITIFEIKQSGISICKNTDIHDA